MAGAAVAAALLVASCGDDGAGTDTTAAPVTTVPTTTVPATTVPATTVPPTTPDSTTAPVTTVAPAERTVNAYFVRGEKVGVGHRRATGTAVARAAVEALLAGPTAAERAAGLSTAIPAGTRLLGLTIAAGTATVDLTGTFASGGGSLSMQLRVAQVVHTLTQFPTVTRVAFHLDGRPVAAIGGEGIVVDPPVGRDTFEGVAPAILVETPAPGDIVASPLRLAGTANTFEAVFQHRLTDAAGHVLAEGNDMATSGTGTRGTFAVSVVFAAPPVGTTGTLRVWESSAKDGSAINVVEIPVVFGRG